MKLEQVTKESQINQPEIVSKSEWLVARKDLLNREKEFTRQRDALSAARRKLPWVKIDKEYVFDGPAGKGDLLAGRCEDLVGGHNNAAVGLDSNLETVLLVRRA